MMYDQIGNPLTAAALSISSGEEKIVTIQMDVQNGLALRCETVPDLQVYAREFKDFFDLEFVDLETTPLPLTDTLSGRSVFQIKLIAAAVTEIKDLSFRLYTEIV